ncbi:hypothetical protein BGZ81_002752 [Podila clonocystis]|nr:hypothetical protein BGZ81_002752 [Podila clonocystis]
MLDRLANFPHIVAAITETFLFSDLLSCALVNHSWSDTIAPVLYLDIITFRFINTTTWGVHPNTVSFLTSPACRYALHKNARHTRALTCKGPESLQVILEAGFCDLLEINFVSGMQDQTLEFELLTRLVAQNPGLRAVSIEDLMVRTNVQFGLLKTFVQFLEVCPHITCFYLESIWKESRERRQEILQMRLDLIKKGNVKTLSQVKMVPRSGRNPLSRPGKRHFWPGRETTIYARDSLGLEDKWSYGRFDHQYNYYYDRDIMAVLVKGQGLVEVCGLQFTASTIQERFPHVQQIRGRWTQLVGLKNLSQLKAIDLLVDCTPETDKFLQDPPPNLSAVHLDVCRREHPQYLLPSDSNRGLRASRLVVTLILGHKLPMPLLLQALMVCPNLEVLSAKTVFIEGSEPGLPATCPQWASRKIKKMGLGFWLDGHDHDMGDFDTGRDQVTVQRSLNSANRIARSFMAQLGSQADLQDLELSFNCAYRCWTSPFLQLAVGPSNGLDQLAGLHRLEHFSITGLLHDLGPVEIEWMKKHWPRLKRIHLPILTKDKKDLVYHIRDCKAHVPDYRPWFRHLEVIQISALHYACGCGSMDDECQWSCGIER